MRPAGAESGASPRLGDGSERADDVIRFGEPVLRLLREDEIAVGDHIELAARSFDHLGFDAESVSNRGRQTGGLRQVVSNLAVAD